MNNRTEQLIESYFANELDETERLELQSLLAADPEAAAEFALQQSLARQASKRSLAPGIQNETWRQASKPPFRKVNMARYIMAAAATLALLISAYFILPMFNAEKSDAVVAESFEHFPNKMKFKNLGGSEELVSPDILAAFAAYDQKNYPDAATQFIAVVAANPTRTDFRFYMGVAFIGANKYHEAINTLLLIAQDANSTYSTPAKYYLGVAYASIKDVPQAKQYLQAYIDAEDGVTFRKQAKRLLRSL
jgi:thioredoxin-like negative regulator of GroEL